MQNQVHATSTITDSAPARTVEVFRGRFAYEGTEIDIDFQAPIGATSAEKDAAFMAALAQKAYINYVAVGQSDEPMDEGDFGLSVTELENKHGHEHPDHTRSDWQHDVSQGDTKLGYWEWVLHNVESKYHDPCDECGEDDCDKRYVAEVGFVCKDCFADKNPNSQITATESIIRQPSDVPMHASTEYFPGATVEEVGSVMMQDIIGDYAFPDNQPEWKWVESKACFHHSRNGNDGIWEFVLNLSCDLSDAPEKLRPVLAEASQKHLSYLIVHQGT